MLVTSAERVKKLFDEGKTEQEVLDAKRSPISMPNGRRTTRSSPPRTRATSIIRSSGCSRRMVEMSRRHQFSQGGTHGPVR